MVKGSQWRLGRNIYRSSPDGDVEEAQFLVLETNRTTRKSGSFRRINSLHCPDSVIDDSVIASTLVLPEFYLLQVALVAEILQYFNILGSHE